MKIYPRADERPGLGALVAEHCKDLGRYLQRGKIRLPEYLVGDVINDALLVIADKRRRGYTFDNVRS